MTATGILQPRDYVDVGTQVSGQLKKLHVEIGATVKAGQLLAEIDPTVYLSQSRRGPRAAAHAGGAARRPQAQLALAEQQFQRQANLMRENATTQDALQTRRSGAALGQSADRRAQGAEPSRRARRCAATKRT